MGFYRIEIKTKTRTELLDITYILQEKVSESKIKNGICYIFLPHTTAGITINENADPSVKQDIIKTLEKLVPWNDSSYEHTEGNSAAHIKASILGHSAVVFIKDGKLQFGTWQGFFFAEFDGPRNRSVWVKILENN